MNPFKNLTETRKRDIFTAAVVFSIVAALLSMFIYINADKTSPPTAAYIEPTWKDCQGYVALTYDDGPVDATPTLLKTLRLHQVLATFFVLGAEVDARPEVLMATASDGHRIGNHTRTHPDLTTLDSAGRTAQLRQTSEAITRVIGVAPDLFRPPMGLTNPEIRTIANDLGMLEVIWTVDTFDWRGDDLNTMLKSVANIKDGDIILMHDASKYVVELTVALLKILESKKLCPGSIAKSASPVKAFGDLTFYAKAVAW